VWEDSFYHLASAAARQHGMITSGQARALGVDDPAVRHLSDAHLLVELDWDVYQVAGSTTGPRYAYPYAAWLALSPELFAWQRPASPPDDAVLSHESACQLHGLGSLADTAMVFTAPRESRAPRAVRVHLASLRPEDVTVREGVPVTTPHRTILDLVRDWTDHRDVGRAMFDAVLLDVVDLADLHADLVPLATQYEFPAEGAKFLGYFLPDLPAGSLSVPNQRAYARLHWPDRVAAVRNDLLPVTGDAQLSWDVAAEIVARLSPVSQ
jgi:hypothetical protein